MITGVSIVLVFFLIILAAFVAWYSIITLREAWICFKEGDLFSCLAYSIFGLVLLSLILFGLIITLTP